MTADVYNQKNEKIGMVELPDNIFGVKWNPDLVHQVITAQLANRRKPLAHVKDRGEVRGGGKKPWRQKHTGRARHGSIRSPLWVHGGVAFGPRKERIFARKINKKAKKAALFSVLSKKLKDDEIKIVNDLELTNPKTKDMANILKMFFGEKFSVLVVPASTNRNAVLAARNIAGVNIANANSFNIYDCLTSKNIFFEQKGLLELIEKLKV